MKILVVTHSSNLSGANKSLLSVINSLKGKINFVVLVNEIDTPISKELKKINIPIMVKKYYWWYAPARGNIIKSCYRYSVDFFKYHSNNKLNKPFLDRLQFEKFDLIYTNTSTIDIGANIANKLKLPHVWHIREFGKEDFGFRRLTSKKYQDKKFTDAKKIILISKIMLENYGKYGNSRVVYNGFEIDKLIYKPRKYDLNEKGKINILVTGQVCEAKGQLQAVIAVSNLRNKGYDIELYLAGKVDSYYLKKILKVNKGESWLKILGLVENIFDLRKMMNIELICSKSEAFGRVIIEAMLHGIPVIASSGGATTELITNGVTGSIYTYKDNISLESKIEYLITHPSKYERISVKGFEEAKKYTIDFTVKELFNIFERALCS